MEDVSSTMENLSANYSVFINWDNDSDPFSNTTHCPQKVKFILNTVVAGTICCLGLVGNVVSFIVLSKDKEAPVAAFLLQSLAFMDNFFLIMWFLHFSLNDSFEYMGVDSRFHLTWFYVRVYTYPLLFVGQTGTIWMIVLIAITRYAAVCKPYRAVRYNNLPTIQKAVCCVFLFAIAYNVPRFFESKVVHRVINDTVRVALKRTRLGNSKTYGLLYFDSLYYIFSFILPLVLLTFLNTKLCLAYRRVQTRRNSMRSLRPENQDHNITLVMIVVILVFIICNAPARVVQIIWGYLPQQCLSMEFLLMEISNVLEVLNSSTNFVVYCVFRSQFRHILQNRFCSLRPSEDFVITDCVPNGRPVESYVTNHLMVCTGLTSETTCIQDPDKDKDLLLNKEAEHKL